MSDKPIIHITKPEVIDEKYFEIAKKRIETCNKWSDLD